MKFVVILLASWLTESFFKSLWCALFVTYHIIILNLLIYWDTNFQLRLTLYPLLYSIIWYNNSFVFKNTYLKWLIIRIILYFNAWIDIVIMIYYYRIILFVCNKCIYIVLLIIISIVLNYLTVTYEECLLTIYYCRFIFCAQNTIIKNLI